MMTLDNTIGYSQIELDRLNEEFRKRYLAGEWPDAQYDEATKWFYDEVSHR